MNNDDFLKKHRTRPDAEFVENLYQKIEASEIKNVTMIFKRQKLKFNPILASTLILLTLGILGLGLSPKRRSLIASWFQPQYPIFIKETIFISDSNIIEPIIFDNDGYIPSQFENVSSTANLEQPSPIKITSSTVSYRIEGLKNEPQKFNNQGPANLAIVLKEEVNGALILILTQLLSDASAQKLFSNLSPSLTCHGLNIDLSQK
ncbi:MAG: hypothetical protein AAGD96_26490 [Chloroflexota bacterium]